MKRFAGKRVFVGFTIALLGLAVGVSVALARSGPGQATAPLYSDPGGVCPPPTTKSYGKATVIRNKGTITVGVKLHGAEPGKYIMELGATSATPGLCDLAGPENIHAFSVDSSGDGEGSGTFALPDFQYFHVGIENIDTGTIYVSSLVKIGSS